MSYFAVIVPCIFLLILGVGSRKTGHEDSAGKIVGGHIGYIIMAPYLVSIQEWDGYHFCGGSIITPWHILTAAHCFRGRTIDNLYIRTGSTFYNRGGQRIQVQKFVLHEDYNAASNYADIAVMLLAARIRITSLSRPVALAKHDPNDGSLLLMTGWGYTSEDATKVPLMMRYAYIPQINWETCHSFFEEYRRNISDTVICAGYEDKAIDTCQGDSGGPAVMGNTQYGIVSWGIGCARPGIPAIYTSVAAFHDWILNIISNM